MNFKNIIRWLQKLPAFIKIQYKIDSNQHLHCSVIVGPLLIRVWFWTKVTPVIIHATHHCGNPCWFSIYSTNGHVLLKTISIYTAPFEAFLFLMEWRISWTIRILAWIERWRTKAFWKRQSTDSYRDNVPDTFPFTIYNITKPVVHDLGRVTSHLKWQQLQFFRARNWDGLNEDKSFDRICHWISN